MRGKTQLEQNNKSKDRNANGRVDPFHMPTELADGLGVESIPRPRLLSKTDSRLAPVSSKPSWIRFDGGELQAFHWVLRAFQRLGRLRRFKRWRIVAIDPVVSRAQPGLEDRPSNPRAVSMRPYGHP